MAAPHHCCPHRIGVEGGQCPARGGSLESVQMAGQGERHALDGLQRLEDPVANGETVIEDVAPTPARPGCHAIDPAPHRPTLPRTRRAYETLRLQFRLLPLPRRVAPPRDPRASAEPQAAGVQPERADGHAEFRTPVIRIHPPEGSAVPLSRARARPPDHLAGRIPWALRRRCPAGRSARRSAARPVSHVGSARCSRWNSPDRAATQQVRTATEPTAATRPRSLRTRSTIMTFSARSLCKETVRVAGGSLDGTRRDRLPAGSGTVPVRPTRCARHDPATATTPNCAPIAARLPYRPSRSVAGLQHSTRGTRSPGTPIRGDLLPNDRHRIARTLPVQRRTTRTALAGGHGGGDALRGPTGRSAPDHVALKPDATAQRPPVSRSRGRPTHLPSSDASPGVRTGMRRRARFILPLPHQRCPPAPGATPRYAFVSSVLSPTKSRT